MFQGPKVYIAPICKVHLHMEPVQQNDRFNRKFQSNIYSL